MVNRIFQIIFLSFYSILIFSQQKEISSQKNELNKIRDEILQLENEIQRAKTKEKKTFEIIDNYNKQSFLLNKLINTFRKETNAKEHQINILESQIKLLEIKTNQLKENYSKYVAAIYKGIYNDKLLYLLNAESVQQLLLRYKYLKKFSDQRRLDLNLISSNKKNLVEYQIKIEEEKKEKQKLISLKVKEENSLLVKLSDKKKYLSQLKKNKELLSNDLAAKKTAEKKIKQLISRLIEKEELRKKELAKKVEAQKKNNELIKSKTSNSSTNEVENFSEYSFSEAKSFEYSKGKLIWPVSKGTVIRKFGENKNEKLKTVSINYGIDIKVISNFSVKTIGEGVVSIIDWIPGYGTVLIITHAGEFRTVYGHLSEIFVSEGEKVSSGKIIGNVGESLEGNILHFEIWNNRNFQNPEAWLARR